MKNLICKIKNTITDDIDTIKYAKSILNIRQIFIVISIISAIACIIYRFVTRFRSYKDLYNTMNDIYQRDLKDEEDYNYDEEEDY